MQNFGNHPTTPGEPLPFGIQPVQLVIEEVGDYENNNGAKVILVGPFMVFLAAVDGKEMEFGIDICKVLEAIQIYQKQSAN